MINTHPTQCNICGGPVVYCSNARVYGREYGSGYCYLCERCGAYVGTHKPRPREALGLLADEPMRTGKKMCHALFDPLWQGKPKAHKKRNDLYSWLARKMDISVEDCHFGYFDIEQLRRAYIILRDIRGKQMKYDNCGKIRFEEDEISCYNQDVRLRFEDGMVARFHYPKAENLGVWGCEIESAGSAGYSLSECFDENADPYSDILETDADLEEIEFI